MNRSLLRYIWLLIFATAVAIPTGAQAVFYTVDRSFNDASFISTLTGTVDIPLGSYTIQNKSASPFTSVNLVLTANGYVYDLNEAVTDFIYGTGQFFINATSTTLTFNTANANGENPADLQCIVSSAMPPYLRNYYAIGSDDAPGFEAAIVPGADLTGNVNLPVIFGTPAPEPRANFLIALAFLTFGFNRIRPKKRETV